MADGPRAPEIRPVWPKRGNIRFGSATTLLACNGPWSASGENEKPRLATRQAGLSWCGLNGQ